VLDLNVSIIALMAPEATTFHGLFCPLRRQDPTIVMQDAIPALMRIQAYSF
jgi:hypothetical protein